MVHLLWMQTFAAHPDEQIPSGITAPFRVFGSKALFVAIN
jgi:hypothetical protein